jgi:hypothetical protein
MYSTKSFIHDKQESCEKKNLTQRKKKRREKEGEKPPQLQMINPQLRSRECDQQKSKQKLKNSPLES